MDQMARAMVRMERATARMVVKVVVVAAAKMAAVEAFVVAAVRMAVKASVAAVARMAVEALRSESTRLNSSHRIASRMPSSA